MANRSSQKVTLFGKPEKIKEVMDYVNKGHSQDHKDESFVSFTFPESITTLKRNDNVILIETAHSSVSCTDISKRFPQVGFYSKSFTDGYGIEEICYSLGGIDLYSVYIRIEGPQIWKEITGNDMEDVNDIVKHYLNS